MAAACERLAGHPQIGAVRHSRNYVSKAAVGGALQNEFLNAAATFQTSLAPAPLLAELQSIEAQLGRHRQHRWGSREIDLDLLLYDDLVLSDPALTVPHPRMAFRRFVLEPAAEIAANLVHPTTKFLVSELLMRLDHLPRHIAITGMSRQQTKSLARRAAAKSHAVLVEDSGIAEMSERIRMLRASPTCGTAIEFVEGERGYLRRVRRDYADMEVATVTEISGSWIGEGLCLAKLLLPVDELREFERSWQSELDADELDRTTLIVILHGAKNDEWPAHMPAEITQLATAPRQSPWLLLDGQDPEWALTEVVAAIEAMQ